MFMTSKVQLLWRDVERARRIAAIQGDMDPKDVWAKIPIHPSVEIAEEAFCRELLFIFPDLLEYCYSMEKIALESGKEISSLKHELNMLKEVPKKVRKPRAKKVKE
jgi:hypothetical protein